MGMSSTLAAAWTISGVSANAAAVPRNSRRCIIFLRRVAVQALGLPQGGMVGLCDIGDEGLGGLLPGWSATTPPPSCRYRRPAPAGIGPTSSSSGWFKTSQTSCSAMSPSPRTSASPPSPFRLILRLHALEDRHAACSMSLMMRASMLPLAGLEYSTTPRLSAPPPAS